MSAALTGLGRTLGGAVVLIAYAWLLREFNHPFLGPGALALFLFPAIAGWIAGWRGPHPVLQAFLAVIIASTVVAWTGSLASRRLEPLLIGSVAGLAAIVASITAWGVSRRPRVAVIVEPVNESNEANRPPGGVVRYCPACGYITGAGICAECGGDWRWSDLRDRPPRQISRPLIASVLLIGIVGAGWYYFQSSAFLQSCPNWGLLRLYRYCKTSSQLDAELAQRFTAGTMSQAEMDELISLVADLRGTIATPERIPAGVPIPCAPANMYLHPLIYHLCPGANVSVGNKRLRINGVSVESIRWEGAESATWHRWSVLPPQPAGDFSLEYSGDVVVTSIPPGPVVLRIPFTQSRVIRVENILPADLVLAMQCETSAARVRFDLDERLVVEMDEQSPPMAGDLFVRSSGTAVWVRATTLIHPASRRSTHGIGGRWVTSPSVDVRYVPNIEYAWAAGLDRYCASTLEWTEVRLSPRH